METEEREADFVLAAVALASDNLNTRRDSAATSSPDKESVSATTAVREQF